MILRGTTTGFRLAVLAALMALGGMRQGWAVSPLRLAGALEGRVADDNGKPQMGAVVQLYNRQEKLIERVLSDDDGFFAFAGLLPDVYSVRVTLATFLPAVRNQIQVQAGKNSLLSVSLSGLFSTIHLLPPASRGDGILNDDWKWVLRSSSSTRPIFRYLPQDSPVAGHGRSTIFADSRGLVRFSAGDVAAGGAVGEMGTAFAFATNVMGSNNVQVAGDVGYGMGAEAPSAAFRTTFSREIGDASPELSVTMRQVYLPSWNTMDGAAGIPDLPPLRSMTASLRDKTQILESLKLEYGIDMDSVAFVDHVHYLSPWARLTWNADKAGAFDLTYTSGNARPELGIPESADPNVELQRDVASLGAAPPVTLRDGRARVQRGENYEVGYSRKFASQRLGTREVRVSGYAESLQNAALTISGARPGMFSGDLLPDLYSDSQLFNVGNYHTMGYTAALTQYIGDNYRITVMYGSVGVLAPQAGTLLSNSADGLRSFLQAGKRQAITTLASATVPHSGTRLVTSYEFMDDRAATAGHMYSTEGNQVDPGLNFSLRQPIPAVPGFPFRMEATAELRNLLAQGYLPISLPDGQQLLLVHTPRSLRGGVNFRF